MSEISDELIDALSKAISFPIMRGAEYEAVRQWLAPILAAERERVKKECMEICDDVWKGLIPDDEWITNKIKRRISELKP